MIGRFVGDAEYRAPAVAEAVAEITGVEDGAAAHVHVETALCGANRGCERENTDADDQQACDSHDVNCLPDLEGAIDRPRLAAVEARSCADKSRRIGVMCVGRKPRRRSLTAYREARLQESRNVRHQLRLSVESGRRRRA
jgi:hypothetical protein